ncbi:MAG: glycosyltransferase family 2 protein [Bacteroidota bacterium]
MINEAKMNDSNPVIVVVAYNRADSLNRLLQSLLYAKDISSAKLIISIDNQEPHNYDVKKLAESFTWPFGEKEVRYQAEHLGLKKHVLQCGDLSREYGAVIVLEDDLFVSPYFYSYAISAMKFYGNDEQIGGISLYNQPRQEAEELPFMPLTDHSDVYFLQLPSSLGQLWTRDQWTQFRTWFDSKPDLSTIPVPDYIIRWPETSWKKYFAAFLLDADKFFVYPRISLTTNFFDAGTHMNDSSSHNGQTQLMLFNPVPRYIKLEDSNCIYDMHLELITESVRELSVEQIEYDFELDLYGSKGIDKIKSPYVITSRPCSNPIKGYRRALKPHEMNVLLNLEGTELSLCKKEDIIIRETDSAERLAEFKYYHTSYIRGTKFFVYRYFRNRKWLQQFFK